MVELEEISLGGLFYRDKKVMQIREEHFGSLLPMLPQPEPIPIDPQRLWKLGFSRYVSTSWRPGGWMKNPLFVYSGRNWGLTLMPGTADEDERIRAGKWLKAYLEEKG